MLGIYVHKNEEAGVEVLVLCFVVHVVVWVKKKGGERFVWSSSVLWCVDAGGVVETRSSDSLFSVPWREEGLGKGGALVIIT